MKDSNSPLQFGQSVVLNSGDDAQIYQFEGVNAGAEYILSYNDGRCKEKVLRGMIQQPNGKQLKQVHRLETNYISTLARGDFKGRKYRVNCDKLCVEFLCNDSGKWKKGQYSIAELESKIRKGEMVKVNLFGATVK